MSGTWDERKLEVLIQRCAVNGCMSTPTVVKFYAFFKISRQCYQLR